MLVLIVIVLTTVVSAVSPCYLHPKSLSCPFFFVPFTQSTCGENEYYEKCSYKCPTQTCTPQPCDPGNGCCVKECRCIDGYLRNDYGKCIPASECGKKPCPAGCKPTCSNPTPYNCEPNPSCNCKDGYVWSDDERNCIRIGECPQNNWCNGDQNAIIQERPIACPSTCCRPNQQPCDKEPLTVGCVCKPGYILSAPGGTCISPYQCSGGYPCKGNTTYASCAVECSSNDYCPSDDSLYYFTCTIAYPCPSGCVCKYGYKRVSSQNSQCILGEECPPVDCTRKNEQWDRCPSACYTDSCNDVPYRNNPCQTLIRPECNPKCSCSCGYARNARGVCVPISQCPPKCVVQ